MISSKALLSHIVNRINNLSRTYTAQIPETPRRYYIVVNGMTKVFLKRGILIKRYEEAFGLPTQAFIFEPDILKAVRKKCRQDRKFREKVRNLALKGFDVEMLVYHLTDSKISLDMRRKYDY